jgi:transcriptional regulator with XRE-family HTH domain
VNVGEKIRQLRTSKNLTQPQLAEAIGIEQSYLSKLENDKSVPSADIFQAILRALSIDVERFLEGIDEQIVHRYLRQIPEVANHLNANVAYRAHQIRKWLYGSAVTCVLGLSLIVAGQRGLIFSNKQYTYQSPGVVLPGEPTDIYDTYHLTLTRRAMGGEITDKEAHKLVAEFRQTRIREDHMLLSDYRGDAFTVAVDGGTRVYALRRAAEYERRENRYLILLGTVLTLAGVFGFIVEARLRGIKHIAVPAHAAPTQ